MGPDRIGGHRDVRGLVRFVVVRLDYERPSLPWQLPDHAVTICDSLESTLFSCILGQGAAHPAQP
jgi:hypothetical protein